VFSPLHLGLLPLFPSPKKPLVTRRSSSDSETSGGKTEIYLARHGQSIHNKQQIVAGQLDSELTGEGVADAQSVAKAIGRSDFDAIYCSDLKRARETAEVIVDALDLTCPLTFSALLRELDYGEYTSKPVSEAFQFLDYKVVQDRRYPGGESFQDLEKRIAQFVGQFRTETEGKRTLIVAHAGSIRMLLIVLDTAHRQHYLTQTFSNRYLGKVLLGDNGNVFSYELIRNGAAESV
jgi:probable phosphoglycerate mutase